MNLWTEQRNKVVLSIMQDKLKRIQVRNMGIIINSQSLSDMVSRLRGDRYL